MQRTYLRFSVDGGLCSSRSWPTASCRFFDLLGPHSLDKKPLNAMFFIPLFVLLQSNGRSQILVGFEFGLRFMVQMAFGGNVCKQVRDIRKSRGVWADGADERNMFGSVSSVDK